MMLLPGLIFCWHKPLVSHLLRHCGCLAQSPKKKEEQELLGDALGEWLLWWSRLSSLINKIVLLCHFFLTELYSWNSASHEPQACWSQRLLVSMPVSSSSSSSTVISCCYSLKRGSGIVCC
uniref:Uncharacterized protein n=1 Tax=Rousettus aegyptiacus TaxID=9407 RepID=A0A7J8D710_ROUAE|nr:hypothetical protein HJG63_008900 [Rousettus aegyptiacus]